MREFREIDDVEDKLRNPERVTHEEAREYVRKFDKSLEESKVEKQEVSSETEIDIDGEVSIDVEPIKEVEKKRMELNPEEIRRLYCDEGQSIRKVSRFFGASEMRVKQELERMGVEIRSSGSQRIELDSKEIRRLYCDEQMSYRKIGRYLGTSSKRIKHELEGMGIEIRPPGRQKIELDPEEIHRLYCDEGQSIRKVSRFFGASEMRVKQELERMGVEIRSSGFEKIELNPEEVYRLYFVELWTLNKMANYLGCKTTTAILRVFEEEGWKTRYQETYETEIDPEEVFRLYNEEGYSIQNIGVHYGVSYGRILRVFKEHNMEYGQKVRIDPDIIYHLYHELGLPRDEVCEQLGISRKPFDRILKEQGWEARPAGFQRVEINLDEFKRLYYDEKASLEEMADILDVSINTLIRYRKYRNLEVRKLLSIHELRNKIFGTECVTCGRPKRDIHKKDGIEHPDEILWRRKYLNELNPDDWVALCRRCHRITHSLMKVFGCEWDDIEQPLKELRSKYLL